ncbi:sulfotransferase [Dyella monticola]|uniref:Sulfotransferase n=1 Tax=Dyella monticola TaxID=1927958 RepID=A0A370X9A1_9GAMM|nr:sulfotransferase [Dyella monticola]RDS84958.1 sulfotransferase [Dyella monticola]
MQRTFVVGCPRSGTTIVQAMLARHPQIFTLPETGFFPRLLGGLDHRFGDEGAQPRRRNLARRLGLTRRYGRKQFLELQRSLLGEVSTRAPWFLDTCVTRFIGMLDNLAKRAQRSMWVEKTPHHLLYLPEIERYSPNARFIHVIRPGMDVLASIMDAHLRYNNNSFNGGLLLWSRRWNRAMEIHRSRIGMRNHHFVFLEDLVRQPAEEWLRLCQFLELPVEAELDQACHQFIADVEAEPWKQAALTGLPHQSVSKAEGLFGPQLRDWLREKLSSYEDLYAAGSLSFDRDDNFGYPAAAPAKRRVETIEADALVEVSVEGHIRVA